MINKIKEKLNQAKEWTIEKWNQTKEWAKRNWKRILAILGIATALALTGPLAPTEISKERLTQKYNQATEIKAKYQLDNASLVRKEIINPELDKYKGEPKDEVKITIGDKDKTEFVPDIELKRWNEVSFKIKPRLSAVLSKDKSLSFEGEKIKFDTPKISFEMHEYLEGEGGFKYIWFLNEKPASNKIEFDIETSGLNFFYQPPLTQEYQNGYSEEFQKEIVVSETQVKDLEGNVLVERPINIVNSFAIYHDTKGGMNDVYGKDYKCGKVAHDFRPHFFDINGLEEWGDLDYIWFDEENGERIVTIPQDFLDKAVYPIKSNDTFGYTTLGASETIDQTAPVTAGRKGTPSSSGTVTDVRLGARLTAGAVNFQGGIYLSSNMSLLSPQGSNQAITTSTKNWTTNSIASGPSVSSQAYYAAVIFNGNVSNTIKFAYDTGGVSGDSRYEAQASNPPSWENPWAGYGNSSSKYSIYATYTPAGGTAALTGTAVPTATEAEIVTGGETIIITLTGDTWVATVGEDNAITTALIAGIDSAQSEAAGWDAVVKAHMVYTDVVRTSNTVVTVTLGDEATYDITATETITVTIPATAVTLAAQIVATPTFTVTAVGAERRIIITQ